MVVGRYLLVEVGEQGDGDVEQSSLALHGCLLPPSLHLHIAVQ